MPKNTIKLISPNDVPIIEIKLTDDTISEFTHSYDRHTKTGYIKILGNNSAAATTKEGSSILVDSDGKEWSTADVEYHSLLKGII